MGVLVMSPHPREVLPSPRRVLARVGSPPRTDGDFEHETASALEALLDLAQPRGFSADLRILSRDEGEIRAGGFRIVSRDMSRRLREAEALSVLMATLGPGPEEECARLEGAREHTRAFFLDAAASEMTEELLRLLHREAARRMQGLRGTARYAPGYGDFSLEHQRDIVELLGGEKTGVRVTESFMLLPRKTTTGVVGWVRQTS